MSIDPSVLEGLVFNDQGLIPAVVQSSSSKKVLMVAWMSEQSLRETISKGETVFWSRSRQELWHKGASSGNTQTVLNIQRDCDADTLLITVEEHGPACHTGSETCFDNVASHKGEK
jgi:phosphoribosyl-AMP cyclohydrolase